MSINTGTFRVTAASGQDIGFYVEHDGTAEQLTIGTGVTALVPYSVIDYNYGGCWDASTERFTAPIDGIYQFNVNCMMQSYAIAASDRFDSGLKINGSYIKYTLREFAAMTAFPSWAYSVMYPMNAGQYIESYIVNQTASTRYTYAGTGYTNFSGFLLQSGIW